MPPSILITTCFLLLCTRMFPNNWNIIHLWSKAAPSKLNNREAHVSFINSFKADEYEPKVINNVLRTYLNITFGFGAEKINLNTSKVQLKILMCNSLLAYILKLYQSEIKHSYKRQKWVCCLLFYTRLYLSQHKELLRLDSSLISPRPSSAYLEILQYLIYLMHF